MVLKQKYSDIMLGIVCPMANERDTVERFVQEVLSVCQTFQFKIIRFYVVLDNASQDGTLELLSNMSRGMSEIKVIFAPENKNVVDAYKKGYQEAIAEKVDWILEIDAGFSHKPSQIHLFFETMLEEDYDCVFGSRFCTGGKMEHGSLKKFAISLGGTYLSNLLLGTRLKDMTSGFELFKREILVCILNKGIHSQGPFFQTEIRTFAHKFKITEVPITYDAGTQHPRHGTILDALRNLTRLCLMRLRGQLGI